MADPIMVALRVGAALQRATLTFSSRPPEFDELVEAVRSHSCWEKPQQPEQSDLLVGNVLELCRQVPENSRVIPWSTIAGAVERAIQAHLDGHPTTEIIFHTDLRDTKRLRPAVSAEVICQRSSDTSR